MPLERRRAVLAAAAAAVLAGGAAFLLRRAALARDEAECRAMARALDKTLRGQSPRYREGIVEHRRDREAGRCLASIEHHYAPCVPTTSKKAPQACAAPDADIAIYAFRDKKVFPLYVCERYASGEARCVESSYGADWSFLSSREFPPEEFPAVKSSLFP